jgi:hypothetical protein
MTHLDELIVILTVAEPRLVNGSRAGSIFFLVFLSGFVGNRLKLTAIVLRNQAAKEHIIYIGNEEESHTIQDSVLITVVLKTILKRSLFFNS